MPAGVFGGPLVVSMRPLKPADAIRAVQITSRFPRCTARRCISVCRPQIGIADIGKPDYGDAVPIGPDELPVFWACGVTPQAVIAQVRPEFCITHAPGSHADHRPAQHETGRALKEFETADERR